MEYVESILYKKINPSDFRKLYDLKKPSTGGGQTYIDMAGISDEDIADFMKYAESSDSTLANDFRRVYTFRGYTLGKDDKAEFDKAPERYFLEFAPRSNRVNYKISRQKLDTKHPAWSEDNGFPTPQKDSSGDYIDVDDFKGIIDCLVIWIIRTSYRKYYVGFLNQKSMPSNWPKNIGLENIFIFNQNEKGGVINLSQISVAFANNSSNPFDGISESQRITNGDNILFYGVPGCGKSWLVKQMYCTGDNEVQRVVFHPDYTNSDFVGQILPEVDGEEITYKFTAGPFTDIMCKAYLNPEKRHILIIEEINRGNAPAIFGDTFQLLDRKKEGDMGSPIGTSEYFITNAEMAKIIYGDPKHEIRIPSNLFIVATMNTSDQNVFTLDTAFQRRWTMHMVENTFEGVSSEFKNTKILDTSVTWENFCTVINEKIEGKDTLLASVEDKRLGVYFVRKEDLECNHYVVPSGKDSLLNEYNKLLASSRNKKRLEEIQKSIEQCRVFPEKVIKYLWDDAVKFNPEKLFDTETYKTLEEVIRHFVFSSKDERFKIFNEDTRSELKLR